LARSKLTTTIDRSGPFFEHDPAKTVRQNGQVLIARVAEEGAADIIAQLQAGESRRAPISRTSGDRVSAHVIGRTQSLTGKPWQMTAVVSVVNRGLSRAEATALMAAASEIEGRAHVFRRTTSRLRRSRAVNRAELLKGLI
jgi:hypothetical protein